MKKIIYLCLAIFSVTGSFAQTIEGVLEWGNATVLSFSVTGTVQLVGVHPGEEIKKSQLLAYLGKQPFDIKIQKYKFKVEEIQPLIFDAKLEMAHAKELFERTVLSEVELQKIEAHLKGLQAREKAAQSDVALAQWQYGKSRLVAPYDGIVVESNLQKGMVISEENKSDVKLIVAQKNIMQVSVLIGIDLIKNIEIGQNVDVVVAGNNYQGVLKAINIGSSAAEKLTAKIQFSHNHKPMYFAGQKAKVIF